MENEQQPEKSSIRKFFKNMDFFSITFQFRVANKEKYSTFFGGVSSMFYIVITLAYMLKSFIDFTSWTDKKIQFITKYESRDTMNITNENFFYAFKFTYVEGFLDPKNPKRKEEEKNVYGSKYWEMFEIENNYVVMDLKIKNKTQIPVIQCNGVNITNFQDLKVDPEDDRNNEKPLNITEHLCFDYKNLSLYGQYTDNKMAYLEVLLKIKKKYYEDLEKLQFILENVLFKFAFYYSDHIYDVSKLEKPVTKRVESTIYSYLDSNYYERVNIFLQNLQYSLDDYMLYKKPKENDYLKFSSYEKSLSPLFNRLQANTTFADKYSYIKYFIRPDMKKTIINVTLMKIPEFLSGVSAISTNLLIIFSIIISFLNRFQAKQKIVTKIMKFNDILKVNNKQEIDYLGAKLKEKNERMERSFNNFKKNILHLNQNNKSYLNETSVIIEEKSKVDNDDLLIKNKNLDNSISINNQGYTDRSGVMLNDNSKSNRGSIVERDINNKNNYGKNFTNTVELQTAKNLGDNTVNLDQESAYIQNKKNILAAAAKKNKANEINLNAKNRFDPKAANLNNISNIHKNKEINNITNSKNHKYEKTDSSVVRGRKQSNPLKITTCDLISNYIWCRNIKDKKTLFAIAEEKFNNNIDILTYQRKMLEIDILKFLILDRDLLEIMNFISKPTVSFKRKSKNIDEIDIFFDSDQFKKNNLCMYKIKDSYDRIVEDEKINNTYVKERILKLFSAQIQELV